MVSSSKSPSKYVAKYGLKLDGHPKRKPGRKRLSPCVHGRLVENSKKRLTGINVNCRSKPGRKRLSPCKYGSTKHTSVCKSKPGRKFKRRSVSH